MCQVLNLVFVSMTAPSLSLNSIQWESRQTDFPIMDSCGDVFLKAKSRKLFCSSAADCSLTFMSAVSIKTHYYHCTIKMRTYNRCWHMERVPKVFVYILMCECRLLLNTSGSCFEIESVWSHSINVNITLNSDPYFLGSTGNRWRLCAGLSLSRICPQLWVWHQLSLPIDCFVQRGMKRKAEQSACEVILLDTCRAVTGRWTVWGSLIF